MNNVKARVPLRWAAMSGLCLAWLVVAGCGGGRAPSRTPAELSTPNKIRKANSLLNAGRVQEALATVASALEDEPDNARLHSFHGQVLFQSGRYGDAEAAFTRALELDPYLTDAHNFLGVVYMQLGRKAEAERELRRALEDPAYPSPEKVYLNLGLLYASQGRDDESIDSLRRSVAINPRYYKAHFELAKVLDRSQQLEEAVREYEVAAPGYAQVGDYHYRLGLALFKLDRRDLARDSLLRVLSVAPGSPSAAQASELLQMMD